MKRLHSPSTLLARIAVATILLGSSLSAFGQGKSEELLRSLPPIVQKAIKAASGLRYSGERVFEMRERSERRKHRETILKDGARMRIEFSSDSPMRGQIIVEDGKKRWHYFPDRQEILVGPSHREESIGRILMLGRMSRGGTGKVTVDPGGAVAGLTTERVTFSDTRGNATSRMWIHEPSGLIMKRELYDPTGAVVGSFAFEKVDLRPRLHPSDFAPIRVNGAKVVTMEDIARKTMKDKGFSNVFLRDPSLELDGVRPFGQGGSEALQLVYQAKNGPVSLIQFKGDVRGSQFDRKMGEGVNIHRFQLRGKNFVLLGQMSEDELRKLAQKAQERE